MRQAILRTGRKWLGVACVAIAGACPGGSAGASATLRIGTGLAVPSTRASLPEAWVAPVSEAPRIDGKLDEAVWGTGRAFELGKLDARAPAAPRTEVRLIRTRDFLFFGARIDEPRMESLRRSVSDRDGPAHEDDSIELFLSPDPSSGYFQLIFSAGGGIFDRIGHGNPAAWDSGATSAVSISQDGWSLEAAIPLASLAPGRIPERWRGNVYRNRHAGGASESQAFSPTLRPDYDVPERFGYLLFTDALPWAEGEVAARRQRGMEIVRLEGGATLLRFDLSALPPGAKISRARLLAERLPVDPADPEPPGPIEILPILEPWREGSIPGKLGQPLRLVPPWYRSFDATAVVESWVSGVAEPVLFVRPCPGWCAERTFLDVLYRTSDGPGNAGRLAGRGAIPPPVTRLRALHRCGQTFLTWREIEDPVGSDSIRWGDMRAILEGLDRRREVRYVIYRSGERISAENVHLAEEIAVVEPLSGWNLNGRSIDRPIDEFIATARVLRWHQWNPFQNASVDGDYGRDCPIDRLTIVPEEGPLPRGTGLYVHTATRDARAYYAVVSRVDGIENLVDIGPENSLAEPVEERVAKPEPVLQGELPRMPFFNYDDRRLHFVQWVAPPLTNLPSAYYNWSVGVPRELGASPPLEVNFHRDGYSYWRTHYRVEPGSIVLCPHDFPLKTWWYGHHEAEGTLKPWTEGAIQPYTERRILEFVDWAARKWNADRARILVTGCRGGASGSGALHLGLRHPEVFSLVIAGHGLADYRAAAHELSSLWGRVEWGIRAESGRSVWEELDLVRYVRSLPPETDLPFVTMTYSENEPSAAELARALEDTGRPVLADTAWGGTRYVAVSKTSTALAVPLEVRKDRAMLAVREEGKAGDAIRNASLLWNSEDMVDEEQTFEATIVARRDFTGTIALRRLQRFRVEPGKSYAWSLASRRGLISAGANGLIALRIEDLPQGSYRLKIAPAGRAATPPGGDR